MTSENASDIMRVNKEVIVMGTATNDRYNYSELLGKLRAKNITQSELAHKISLNPSTLNLKLNNKSEFSQSEMRSIVGVLGEPVSMIAKYFFAH